MSDESTRCKICSDVSVRKELVSLLSVSVLNLESGGIARGLAELEELQEVESSAICRTCHSSEWHLLSSVVQWPKFLCIAVKRFQWDDGKMRKVNSRVARLSDITVGGYSYTLQAVVVHHGSPLSGHYVAIVKRCGQWILHDDSRVDEMGVLEAAQRASFGHVFSMPAV